VLQDTAAQTMSLAIAWTLTNATRYRRVVQQRFAITQRARSHVRAMEDIMEMVLFVMRVTPVIHVVKTFLRLQCVMLELMHVL